MLTVDEVVDRLVEHKPEGLGGVLKKCKLPLKFINDGAYRDTFSVVGTPTILKIPRKPVEIEYDYDYDKHINVVKSIKSNCDVDHSLTEFKIIDKIKRSRRKFTFLHPYLPEIYHMNSVTGISLGKRYYKIGSKRHRKLIDDQLVPKIKKAMGLHHDWDEIDLHDGNFAEDKDGSLKLIDFGGFEGWGF